MNPLLTTNNNPSIAPLLLTATMLFWAGNAVIGKLAINYIPPFTLAFLRWVLALLILLPFTWKRIRAQKAELMQHRMLIIGTGILGIGMFNTLQYWALDWTTAINVGVINATIPTVVFFLSWVSGRDRANGQQLLGLAISIAGVFAVVGQGSILGLGQLSINAGDGLMLAAVFGFAIYSVSLRRFPAHLDSLALLSVQIMVGIIVTAPFWFYEFYIYDRPVMRLETGLILLYVAIFPSVLAYIFWTKAIKLAGANVAAMFVNLAPIFTSLLAVILLKEHLYLYHVIAILAVAVGIYLAVFRPS